MLVQPLPHEAPWVAPSVAEDRWGRRQGRQAALPARSLVPLVRTCAFKTRPWVLVSTVKTE